MRLDFDQDAGVAELLDSGRSTRGTLIDFLRYLDQSSIDRDKKQASATMSVYIRDPFGVSQQKMEPPLGTCIKFSEASCFVSQIP